MSMLNAQQQPQQQRSAALVPRAFRPVALPLRKFPLPPRQTSNPLKALTRDLLHTYTGCNQDYKYSSKLNPRRTLTKPSQPAGNQNYDNANGDYILYVSDVLEGKNKYVVLDLLGQGTFGQVVKCRKLGSDEVFAVKIIKSKRAYFNQGLIETKILEKLNTIYDPDDRFNIVRLHEFFIFRRHLCLVFELLSINLYELLKQNQYRGLSTVLLRVFLVQILEALVVLSSAKVMHCDLKPENILLTSLTSPEIKLIDFGSACFENHTVYSYIQSRFYRSPEVIIGYSYSPAIDIWSLGCIAAELFLGLPLFPGHSEYNQLVRIIEMRGPIPDHLLESGKSTNKFFDKENGVFKLKSEEQYAMETKTKVQPFKRYFNFTNITDLIYNYPYKKDLTLDQLEIERTNRKAFAHFVTGLLQIDPAERWTAEQASKHPFITGEPFTGTFTPLRQQFSPMSNAPMSRSIPQAIPRANPNQPYYPSPIQRPNHASNYMSDSYSSPHISPYMPASLGVSPSMNLPQPGIGGSNMTYNYPNQKGMSVYDTSPNSSISKATSSSYSSNSHRHRNRSNSSPPRQIHPKSQVASQTSSSYTSTTTTSSSSKPRSCTSPQVFNPPPNTGLKNDQNSSYRSNDRGALNSTRGQGRQRSNSNPHSPPRSSTFGKDMPQSKFNTKGAEGTPQGRKKGSLRRKKREYESQGNNFDILVASRPPANQVAEHSNPSSGEGTSPPGEWNSNQSDTSWEDSFFFDEQLANEHSPRSPHRSGVWQNQFGAPPQGIPDVVYSFGNLSVTESQSPYIPMMPTLGSSVSSGSYVPPGAFSGSFTSPGHYFSTPSGTSYGTSPYMSQMPMMGANNIFGSSPSMPQLGETPVSRGMYIPHSSGANTGGAGSLESGHFQTMHRPRSPSNSTLPIGDDDDPYRSGEKSRYQSQKSKGFFN